MFHSYYHKILSLMTFFSRYMLANQSTSEDLLMMKNGLTKDGYCESGLMPTGWMVKLKKHKSNFIMLSPSFETFKSVKKMLKHMEANSYSKESVQNIKDNFLTQRTQLNESPEEKPDNEDFKKLDRSAESPVKSTRERLLPLGWMFKQFSNSVDLILTSPEGKHFLSQQAALEWVSRREGRSEEKRALTDGLEQEGWRRMEGLPKGWMARFCPVSNQPRMVSEEGSVAHGLVEAEALPEGEEKAALVSWAKAALTKREESAEVWDSCPSLPEGWKLSSNGLVKDSCGVILGGRVEGVRAMIRKQCPPKSIFTLWSSLGKEGWKEVEGLPSGWRSKGTSYLSPLMEEVTSKEALLHFLHISKEYTEDEVQKTRQALNEQ